MQIYKREIPDVQRDVRLEAERSAVMLLLRQVLGEGTTLSHLSNGAPILPQHPNTYISISHTKGLVMLALSDEPIGIDVEKISERVCQVTPRLLPPTLQRAIRLSPDCLTSKLYHIAWTAMEALFKLVAESEGLSDFKYQPGSLTIDEALQTFSLIAYYKRSPEMPLYVQGNFEAEYVFSVASYLYPDQSF